jgi:hypothetical protein
VKLRTQAWTVSRKKVRPSFSLGALGMLFSVSDRVSGPKLSDQDRLDAAYPYRLELAAAGVAAGRYRLLPAGSGAGDRGSGIPTEDRIKDWASGLNGRVWRSESGRAGPRLVTDLTEYERLRWEELAVQGAPMLEFELLG